MKKYKLHLNRIMLKGLSDLLHLIITEPADDDEHKLLIATLADLKIKIDVKMVTPQAKYKMPITPAQAFALRLVQQYYCNDVTSNMGNKLLQVSNEVNQFYQ